MCLAMHHHSAASQMRAQMHVRWRVLNHVAPALLPETSRKPQVNPTCWHSHRCPRFAASSSPPNAQLAQLDRPRSIADPSAEPAMAAASTIGSGPSRARASWQRLISAGLNCSIMPTTGSSAALSPAQSCRDRQGLPAHYTAIACNTSRTHRGGAACHQAHRRVPLVDEHAWAVQSCCSGSGSGAGSA